MNNMNYIGKTASNRENPYEKGKGTLLKAGGEMAMHNMGMKNNYGGQQEFINKANNFEQRNIQNRTNNNNLTSNIKYNDDEINEARESLRLLNQKMTVKTGGTSGNMSNTMNQPSIVGSRVNSTKNNVKLGNTTNNTMSTMTGMSGISGISGNSSKNMYQVTNNDLSSQNPSSGNTGNYRKPFKPNLGGGSGLNNMGNMGGNMNNMNNMGGYNNRGEMDNYNNEGYYKNTSNNMTTNNYNILNSNSNTGNMMYNKPKTGTNDNPRVRNYSNNMTSGGMNMGLNNGYGNDAYDNQDYGKMGSNNKLPSSKPSTNSGMKSNAYNQYNPNANAVATNSKQGNSYGNIGNRKTNAPNTSHNMNNMPNNRKLYEEVDDDRPAFASGNKDDQLEEYPEDEGEDQNGEECGICGRKFNVQSYAKHAKICKKVFASKRKAFNTKNKRILDSEHAMIVKNAELEEKKKAKQLQAKKEQQKGKEPKWKKQSEEFRRAMQGVKSDNNDGNFVVTKGQPQQSSAYDDYSHCDICNRRYNEEAYKRHLPTCQRKQKEQVMKGNNSKGTASNNTKPNINVKFNKR